MALLFDKIFSMLASQADRHVAKAKIEGLSDEEYLTLKDEFEKRKKNQFFTVYVTDLFFFENIKRNISN